MGEHRVCNARVVGSSPIVSIFFCSRSLAAGGVAGIAPSYANAWMNRPGKPPYFSILTEPAGLFRRTNGGTRSGGSGDRQYSATEFCHWAQKRPFDRICCHDYIYVSRYSLPTAGCRFSSEVSGLSRWISVCNEPGHCPLGRVMFLFTEHVFVHRTIASH